MSERATASWLPLRPGWYAIVGVVGASGVVMAAVAATMSEYSWL